MPLTLTALKNIPLIRQGDNLADVILDGIHQTGLAVEDNDIFVLAQKIVSKAEGRMVDLAAVTPGPEAKELALQVDKDPRVVELMLAESTAVLRARLGTIIVVHKLGFVCANAGIDHSNVSPKGPTEPDFVLLLPQNPDQSAARIRETIEARTKKKVGVMVIDS